jgi:hypothetical protein
MQTPEACKQIKELKGIESNNYIIYRGTQYMIRINVYICESVNLDEAGVVGDHSRFLFIYLKTPQACQSKELRGGNRYVTVLYPRTSLRHGYSFARQWLKTYLDRMPWHKSLFHLV